MVVEQSRQNTLRGKNIFKKIVNADITIGLMERLAKFSLMNCLKLQIGRREDMVNTKHVRKRKTNLQILKHRNKKLNLQEWIHHLCVD